jgi:hypothetical protein
MRAGKTQNIDVTPNWHLGKRRRRVILLLVSMHGAVVVEILTCIDNLIETVKGRSIEALQWGLGIFNQNSIFVLLKLVGQRCKLQPTR